jgi:hypothetical protein
MRKEQAQRRLDDIKNLVAEGAIHLGMTRDEVRAVLGEPDDVGGTSRRYKIPLIWKYGDVEFHWSALARSSQQAAMDGLSLIMVDGWKDGPDPIILLQQAAAKQ